VSQEGEARAFLAGYQRALDRVLEAYEAGGWPAVTELVERCLTVDTEAVVAAMEPKE
jgi:hypothetical protein